MDDFVDRAVIAALNREIRRQGHGAVAAVGRAVGMADNWWHQVLRNGRLRVDHMVGACQHLGLDPARFLREALGNQEELGIHRPPGKPPEIVRRAWHRFQTEDPQSGTLDEAPIKTIDTLRYEDPQKAVRLAHDTVELIRCELLPRLLGVTASAWRIQLETLSSRHALYAGLQMAEKLQDEVSRSDLLQRMAYVVAEEGDYFEALRLSRITTELTAVRGEPARFASTLVEQGIWLSRLERCHEAISVLRIASEVLPQEEIRNRFAAFQITAHNYCKLGLLEDASLYIELASELAPSLDSWAQNKLQWIRALFYEQSGEFNRASRILQEVMDYLSKIHLGEMAQAACQLTKVELLANRPENAYRAATVLRALLEPLADNLTVEKAIADLLRDGKQGLTISLVQKVTSIIAIETAKPSAAHLLKIGSYSV